MTPEGGHVAVSPATIRPKPRGSRREAGVSTLLARLLRRARSPTAPRRPARSSHPGEGPFHDPDRMLERRSRRRAPRLDRPRADGRVVVFGDYDVDGVTAVAQLRAALRLAGGGGGGASSRTDCGTATA